MATSTKHLCALALCCTALVGCSSAAVKEKPACVFADGSEKAAPLWVCATPKPNFALSGIGYADASRTGADTSLKLARAEALSNLYKNLRAYVRQALDNYANKYGFSSNHDLAELKRSVLHEIDRDVLVDAQLINSSTTPSGGEVVALGLDPYDLATVSRIALQQSHAKQPELWQYWLANTDFVHVQEEIIRPYSAETNP